MYDREVCYAHNILIGSHEYIHSVYSKCITQSIVRLAATSTINHTSYHFMLHCTRLHLRYVMNNKTMLFQNFPVIPQFRSDILRYDSQIPPPAVWRRWAEKTPIYRYLRQNSTVEIKSWVESNVQSRSERDV